MKSPSAPQVLALLALVSCLGCATITPPQTSAPTIGPGASPLTTATVASPAPAPSTPPGPAGSLPLSPDPSAELTVGDTVRLTGGEFVGDQADFTLLEAVLLPASAVGVPRYAFLVDITGLDDTTFPYNVLDFSLFDDQSFEYQPYFEGGQEPRLEFGDLPTGRQVRGWLTFDGPAETAFVELQYSPAMALEIAIFRMLVPA